jgi:hypothetical protein
MTHGAGDWPLRQDRKSPEIKLTTERFGRKGLPFIGWLSTPVKKRYKGEA